MNQIKPSSLPDSALKKSLSHSQNLITLASVEDDGLGEELQVVWEIEPGARIIEHTSLPDPVGFDAPTELDAFLDAVRWGAASTADVKNIQSPFRRGVQIEDYQLDPVVRGIQMPSVTISTVVDLLESDSNTVRVKAPKPITKDSPNSTAKAQARNWSYESASSVGMRTTEVVD